ncbi:MAG: DUF2779 domain-containing protein [Melioribacteraceae bacterium]|nr:DUF2779 domain-containing protein [Melioribacteraceae bacterium]
MRYLTKSRFRLALECITKLYYTKKNDYADESLDDPFLLALAEGGFQVGELVKYLFSDNPTKENITIDTLDYQESLSETAKRLHQKDVVIAEAAFSFNSLFIRADIIVKRGNIIHLYEVKAKSSDGGDIDFVSKKKEGGITSKWAPYLYDVAFQKYVIAKSLASKNIIVRANLVLVDKSKVTTVDGLNQKFKIIKMNNRSRVEIEPNMNKSELGDSILKIQNIDDEIDKIWNEFPVPSDYKKLGFEEFIQMCEKIYTNDKLLYAPLGSKCRACQFINSDSTNNPSKKSGFHECWQNKTNLGDRLYNDSLVIDLWGGLMGSRSIVQELIDNGKYLIADLNENDVIPKSNDKSYHGLSPFERRMQQINRVKRNTKESYFDKKRFEEVKRTWKYPLHMIDFETSMPALPFHKDMHPYEGIAFQFSHHLMEENGVIRHAGQYLSFERGVFPNYEFVRELKLQLENDHGTIFRYHNHENTYLNIIYNQLQADPNPPHDRDSLCGFIKRITTSTINNKEKEIGPRNMVDLWDLVLRFYYSPNAKGSNSIKAILPAIISESDFLKDKYSKPIYGRNKLVHSLNFDEHIWIDPFKNYDPYKTLPKLFDDYSIEELDKLSESIGEFKEVADGGAAMTAYNYLQFSYVPDDQRERLKNGLLRYCELDTMAMVMILEGWFNKTE